MSRRINKKGSTYTHLFQTPYAERFPSAEDLRRIDNHFGSMFPPRHGYGHYFHWMKHTRVYGILLNVEKANAGATRPQGVQLQMETDCFLDLDAPLRAALHEIIISQELGLYGEEEDV